MEKQLDDIKTLLNKKRRKTLLSLLIISISIVLLFFLSIGIGSSHISMIDSWKALFGFGEESVKNIIIKIRLPRTLGALVIGAALSLSGLLMQSVLKNPMASPATLGVSNAASFGANIGIMALSGMGLAGLGDFSIASKSPWLVSLFALLFSFICLGVVLLLSSLVKFKPSSVILIGVAFTSFFQALTTLLQYFADDVSLSAVTNWAFGNLERLNYTHIVIIAVISIIALAISQTLSYKLNALMGGESLAKSMGVRTGLVRFIALLMSSIMTAVSVCFTGIIGFIGIMAPQSLKRILGNNMKILIPFSFLGGGALLLLCDIFTRLIGNGTSLPVGAITALIGVPFFIVIIFTRKEAIK